MRHDEEPKRRIVPSEQRVRDFVAPTGKDNADGSQVGPVKTIAKALELAADTKLVIACVGTYDEQLKLTVSARLYGGFACPGSVSPWEYEPTEKAKVAPSNRGLALNVASGDAAVVIEDFEFRAKDGVEAGESSVAAFVNGSTNVALRRVKLTSGKGVDGVNGALAPLTFPDPLTLKGNSANGDSGGASNTGMCTVGQKPRGGAGGNGGGGAVTTGGSGTPDLGMGKGATAGSCSTSGTGQDGANASPQSAAPGRDETRHNHRHWLEWQRRCRRCHRNTWARCGRRSRGPHGRRWRWVGVQAAAVVRAQQAVKRAARPSPCSS